MKCGLVEHALNNRFLNTLSHFGRAAIPPDIVKNGIPYMEHQQ